MELLMNLEYWHWWILALVFLIFEVLGFSGFLLGAVVAAVATGLVALVAPVGWEVQITLFGIMAVVFTVVYWKKFRRFNQKTDQEGLNTVEQRLMGKHGSVVKVLSSTEVKIQIGDTLWTATADTEHQEGDKVTVSKVVNQVPHVT